MLKDFIKIQFIIVLILILNVVATKKVKLPKEVKVKETLTKDSKKTHIAPSKKTPFEISYVGKNPALKHLFKNRF